MKHRRFLGLMLVFGLLVMGLGSYAVVTVRYENLRNSRAWAAYGVVEGVIAAALIAAVVVPRKSD